MRTSSTDRVGMNPIPARGFVFLAGTALGLVLLFSFKTPDQPPPRLAGAFDAAGAPSPAASSGPLIAAAPPNGDSGGPARTAQPADASPPPANSSPAPAGSRGPGGSKVVTGDDVSNRFGDVQVQVTFSGGKMVDVRALRLPFDRARSAAISNFVEPYLRSEALQAQTAQIDLISGATYTSESYSESLQSAIDKAKA